MENTTGVGFMAVFAVSGSVALLAFKMHKRLLSDFMKKIESELGYEKYEEEQSKKKVRFAEDVIEPSSNNKEYRRRRVIKLEREGEHATMAEEEDYHAMPLNRLALYKGIIEFRTVRGYDILQNC